MIIAFSTSSDSASPLGNRWFVQFSAGGRRIRTTGPSFAKLAKFAASLDFQIHGRRLVRAAIRPQSPAYLCAGGGTKPPISAASRRANSIVVGSSPSGPMICNPLILHGQTHGGIAQGVGQALLENSYYEPQSGQLLAASFTDYAMPRADTLPALSTALSEVPTPTNRLGVRSGGEGGTTPALAAVINAVVNALSELGVRHIEMPAAPERVWRNIRTAIAGRSKALKLSLCPRELAYGSRKARSRRKS